MKLLRKTMAVGIGIRYMKKVRSLGTKMILMDRGR